MTDTDLSDYAERLDALADSGDSAAWARGRLLVDCEAEHGRGVAALLAHGERRYRLAQLRAEKRVAAAFPEALFPGLSWSHYREVAALAGRDFEAACDCLERADDGGWTVGEFAVYVRAHHGRDPRGRPAYQVPEPDVATQDQYAYTRSELAARCPWLRGVHLDEVAGAALDALLTWQDARQPVAVAAPLTARGIMAIDAAVGSEAGAAQEGDHAKQGQ